MQKSAPSHGGENFDQLGTSQKNYESNKCHHNENTQFFHHFEQAIHTRISVGSIQDFVSFQFSSHYRTTCGYPLSNREQKHMIKTH